MQRERNINYGWVKLPRMILDWKHIKNINAVYLYVYLLLSADRETGSVTVSIRGLAEKTGLSVQKVRTLLKLLVREGMVTQHLTHELTQQLTQQTSVITICDLVDYDGQFDGSQHTFQHTFQHSNQHTLQKGFPPTPPFLKNKQEKENIAYANAHAHTRERLIAEANVDLRIEQGCRSLGIDPATYQELLDAVINDWEFTNVPEEEWTMAHLLQTMRIKNNIKKRENNGQAQNGNNRQPVAAGRADRAAAVAATMAALGTAGTQTESLPY